MLVVTLEWREGGDGGERGRGPHPLDRLPHTTYRNMQGIHLPRGHQPDVLHRCDRVKEQLKAFLVVRGGEPTKMYYYVITSFSQSPNYCSAIIVCTIIAWHPGPKAPLWSRVARQRRVARTTVGCLDDYSIHTRRGCNHKSLGCLPLSSYLPLFLPTFLPFKNHQPFLFDI